MGKELRNKEWNWRNFINNTAPPVLLIYAFSALILLGTLLLCLPPLHAPGRSVSVLDCFFTITSAACVTGLVTVSVSDNFNFWGQLLIMLVFQLGGLGVMTFAAVSFKLLGSRLSLRGQAALEDSLYQRDAAMEFNRTFHYIFYIVFIIELCGAIVLALLLSRQMSLPQALWSGVFHSVSAFCNAGFSLWNDSLAGQDNYILVVITILIVSGGLGHIVLVELARLAKRTLLFQRKSEGIHVFSYHTRVVLVISSTVLVTGAIGMYLLGTTGNDGQWQTAIFQSVTARTAGFSTIPQTLLPMPALILMLFLMFIGGAPGSCAGGIKVTSLGIWLANLRSAIFQRREGTLLGRNIPQEIQIKVRRLLNLAVFWNATGVLVLSICQPEADFLRLAFEQISAFATVGLSMDFTPALTSAGKIWIILTMFLGRLGPLTIALSVVGARTSGISHPEGRIMIG